jgi:hypothetical protein
LRMARARLALAFLLLPVLLGAQGNARRLTTIDAVRQFPGYYHLQNVLIHGEFVDDPKQPRLRSDDGELPVLLESVTTKSGAVEVRGTIFDVGRLDPTDPRLQKYAETRSADNWPKPGEVLLLRVNSVAEAAPSPTATVRALALEPWKFEGQTVTVSGNFRGRNLFGDTPDSPGNGRYDFVIRGAEAAVWVTGLRPRGKGFDLDVDRRLDTDKWVEVTGKVVRKRGLVAIEATKLELAKAPEARPVEEDAPPPPPPPLDVVFSSPTEGETDVLTTAPIRIQFSRGLKESTLANRIKVNYADTTMTPVPAFKTTYDAPTRSIQIQFAAPLEPFRTVKVTIDDGLLAFDNGTFAPWSLTFTVGQK